MFISYLKRKEKYLDLKELDILITALQALGVGRADSASSLERFNAHDNITKTDLLHILLDVQDAEKQS